MKKTGYLLLVALKCSLAFGAVAPAVLPVTNVQGVVDTFILNEDVGRFTIKWRNRGYSAIDNPITKAAYGMAGVTGVTALSKTVQECGLTGAACMLEQVSFANTILSVCIAVPLLSITTWHWEIKHRQVYSASNVKDELKGILGGVLLNDARTARATTWPQTQGNVDKFLRFSLAKYRSHYRASSKFEIDSFKSELENWTP